MTSRDATFFSRKTLRIGITLGAITGLIGCAEQADDAQTNGAGDAALAMTNGLSMVNGLTMTNGLTMANGLNMANGLSMTNGLTMTNGLSMTNGYMTTSGGRKLISYIAKCALAAGDSFTKQDQYGTSYTFPGGIGLCPAWKNGSISGDSTCQELISACVMAHVNTAGIHIPIWLDSSAPAIGWGLNTNYAYQEGTFFGNILAAGNLSNLGKPSITAPAAYFCDGDSFPPGNSNGEVAGRLGYGSYNAPYANPFGDGVLCKNTGAVAEYSQGSTGHSADGYKALSVNGATWNNAVTVWRSPNYTPVFDAAYTYNIWSLMTRSSPMTMDVPGGNQSSGTAVQTWDLSANYDSSKFDITNQGSGFKIVMHANNNKCLDAANGNNNDLVAIRDCNGSAAQTWSIQPQGNSFGSFLIKSGNTGRCLTLGGTSTQQRAHGDTMVSYDCSGWSAQMYRIQAVALQ